MVASISRKTIIVLVAFSIVTFSCRSSNDEPQTIGDSKELEYYSIDPDSFIQNYRQNNQLIITPIAATPDPYPAPPRKNETIKWTYQDYFGVSGALGNAIWEDGVHNWKLLRMYFIVSCQDPMDGFTIGDFYYFHERDVNNQNIYDGREILIRPLYADITIGAGATYQKPLLGWEEIDPSNVKVDANNALDIAESHGGQNFRASVRNGCQVSLTINPNSGYKGWKVSYNSHNTSFFEMEIDAANGRYRIK